MTEEDFSDWLDNPVTQYVIKYLKDSVKESSSILAESIINGGVETEAEQVRVGTLCVTLTQISEITLQEIEDFYSD